MAPPRALLNQSVGKAALDEGSVSVVATPEDVGEQVQFVLDGVRLPRQQSAMLPIIGQRVKAERLSIVGPGPPRRALLGARLVNTTGVPLPEGPLTVFDEGGYAGDALLDAAPPDAKRLVAFALDPDLIVDQTGDSDEQSTLSLVTISEGLLRVERVQQVRAAYQFTHEGERARTVLIEHLKPEVRDERYELVRVEGGELVETTGEAFRVEGPVAAGGQTTITLHFERTALEILRLENEYDADVSIVAFVEAYGSAIPPRIRRALDEVRERLGRVQRRQEALEQTRNEIRQIVQDQERLRKNIQTAGTDSDYGRRLLAKLEGQEGDLERLRRRETEQEEALQQERATLREYTEALTVK